MSRSGDLRELNRAIRILSRSFIQYAHDVGTLWTDDDTDREIAAAVAATCEADASVDMDLGDIVMERGGSVMAGSFPFDYTSHNYVRWTSIVDQIAREIPGDQSALDEIARRFVGDPDAGPILRRVIEERRPHLDKLIDISRRAKA